MTFKQFKDFLIGSGFKYLGTTSDTEEDFVLYRYEFDDSSRIEIYVDTEWETTGYLATVAFLDENGYYVSDKGFEQPQTWDDVVEFIEE